MLKIAVLGDIHTLLDAEDVQRLNESDYHLVLICGDLPGRSHKQTVSIARILSGLRRPSLLIPGNHDATSVLQLLGEITGSQRLKRGDSGSIAKMQRRVQELQEALGPVRLGGYSIHSFRKKKGWQEQSEGADLDIICARPHSMGGPGIGFKPYIEATFGVSDDSVSAAKIRALLESSRAKQRIILAHNGPLGLGAKPADIWGCDFDASRGDFGDADLSLALESSVRPSAVIAGHMHHALKGGGQRVWHVERDGIHYVNAARVPRIFDRNGKKQRHHVRIELDSEGVAVHEILW